MGDDADIPVLRRKAGARRGSQGLADMTPDRAMRLALARAGDRTLGVRAGLQSLEIGSVLPDTLAAALPDSALILRLDGPDGAIALAALCPQSVGAAIEAQTLGKVLNAPAPDRRPTATDALLVRDFVEAVLSGFADLAEDLRGLPPVDGYAFGGRLEDARAAAMTIRDAPHLHLTADIDFAAGSKAGALHLILPDRHAAIAAAQGGAPWAAALEKAVLASPARLEAQLARLHLPLADLAALHVGQVLPLGRAALDAVTIRASDGRTLMTARLGRSGAMRAVRLRIAGGVPRPAALAGAGAPEEAAVPAAPAASP